MKINELSENFFASICEHGFIYDNEWLTRINPSKVDFILRYKKGDLKLTEENEEECKNSVIAMLMENEYKYNRLTASLDFDYNPIENYNMSETLESNSEKNELLESENEIVSGERNEKITNVNGARNETNTNIIGEKIERTINENGQRHEIITDDFGQKTTSTIEKLGNISETINETLGEDVQSIDKTFSKSNDSISKNDKTENRKNAFDVVSADLPIDNNSTLTSTETVAKGERTESELLTVNEKSNSTTKLIDSIANSNDVTVENYSDTHEKTVDCFIDNVNKVNESSTDSVNIKTESYTDTQNIKSDSVTNTENKNEDNKITEKNNHILNRSGNIGVTTTQQMIVQEREVALFSFYNILVNDILDCISLRIWEL